VLVALGVHPDGREELLDFAVARSESVTAWAPFVQRLRNRGVERVRLVVHDDCAAIALAVSLTWPESLEQVCIWHVLRNFSQALRGHPKRRELVRWACWLYEAQSLDEFESWSIQFRRHWQHIRHPALARFIAQWPATTRYLALPRSWWAAAKTSNLLERWFGELRRRLDIVRRFPNPRSCERWVYALIARFNNTEYRVPGWNESQQL